MGRQNWRIALSHSEATAEFPFAVVDSKGWAVALVKTKEDARFIAEAGRRIAQLDSDRSTYQRYYYGSIARH